jgi:ribonucleoside-triphosphate reductase
MSEILVSKQDKDKIKDVLQKIHDKCDEFYKRSNIAFSLYGTPSEGYCLKSATAFKKMFGEGVIERDYLTNSFHLPVWVSTDPYHKFLYEKDFAKISNGGNISYVEQPNLKNNKKAYEDLLDFAYKHVHYFGINMPVDKCFKCGFSGEFLCTSKGFRCPQCDNRDEDSINVIRRVSGYLTAPNSRPFNKGKQQEVSERVKHTNKG